jgi:hypothetical protein
MKQALAEAIAHIDESINQLSKVSVYALDFGDENSFNYFLDRTGELVVISKKLKAKMRQRYGK